MSNATRVRVELEMMELDARRREAMSKHAWDPDGDPSDVPPDPDPSPDPDPPKERRSRAVSKGIYMEFTPEVVTKIDQMARKLNVRTKAEVVRKALNLLNYTLDEQERGSRLIFENEEENTRKEVVTL